MRIPFGLPQGEDGPQIVGQGLDSTLHIPTDSVVGRLRGNFFIECNLSPPACRAETHERETDDHSLQPPLETAALVVLVNRIRQTNEEIVQDVFRVLHRARHTPCETK